MKWDSKILLKLIKGNLGDRYCEDIEHHIYSIHWKFNIGKYHAYTAMNAFEDVFNNEEIDVFEAFDYLFGLLTRHINTDHKPKQHMKSTDG